MLSSPPLRRSSLDAVAKDVLDIENRFKEKTDFLAAELGRLERKKVLNDVPIYKYIPLEKVQEAGEKMETFIAEEMKNYGEKLQEQRKQHSHCGGQFQLVSALQNRVGDLSLKVNTLETILFTLPKFLKEITE